MLNFEITHRQLGLESIKGNLHALLVISLVCERTYQKYFSKFQRLSDLLLLLSKFSFSYLLQNEPVWGSENTTNAK